MRRSKPNLTFSSDPRQKRVRKPLSYLEKLVRDDDTDIPDLVNIMENRRLWKIFNNSHLDRSRTMQVSKLYKFYIIFPDTRKHFHLFNLISTSLRQYNPLMHWFDTYFQVLSKQISGVNCVQRLTSNHEVHNKHVKICWKEGGPFFVQLFANKFCVSFVYNFYT